MQFLEMEQWLKGTEKDHMHLMSVLDKISWNAHTYRAEQRTSAIVACEFKLFENHLIRVPLQC